MRFTPEEHPEKAGFPAAVGPYAFRIRSAGMPGLVREEPGATSLAHDYRAGVLTVTLPRLEIHTCIVVEGWQRPATL